MPLKIYARLTRYRLGLAGIWLLHRNEQPHRKNPVRLPVIGGMKEGTNWDTAARLRLPTCAMPLKLK
jgi:hypothetical protein